MSLVLTALLLLSPPADPLLEWEQRVHDSGGLTIDLITEYREITEALAPPIVLAPQPKPRAAAPVPVSVEHWRPLVEAYFSENTDRALRVMACESGGDPNAKNPRSSASGAFQFLRSTWDWVAIPLGFGSHDSGAVFNIEANVHAASVLSKGGSDWSHWVCQG